MKTTLELSDALVRELQRRAQQGGQDLADTASELIRKGLAASPASDGSSSRATVKTHASTGLPYIECSHAASPETEMTPGRFAEILLEQEANRHREAGR